MAEIKGLFGNFVFIGTLTKQKDESKFYSADTNDDGYFYHRIRFGVQTSENNRPFLEMMGGYHTRKPNVIYTKDKNGNDLEITWQDRFDKVIVDNVAEYRKLKLNLVSSNESDNEVFLSEYDFIENLKKNFPTDARVVVMGNVRAEKYKDKQGNNRVSMKFVPNKIRLAKDEETNKAEVTLQFIFDKDSWDESTLKQDKKVSIGGYFTTYDRARKANVFVLIPNLILNCEKLDFDNPKHTAIFDYYKSCFEAKHREYYETQWHCEYKCGVNEEEITMDDLTENQKVQIELGLATFEQIKKDMRNSMATTKINELWLIRPTNKYDGNVNELTTYTEDDFFVDDVEESKDDLFGGSDDTVDESIESLFGGR